MQIVDRSKGRDQVRRRMDLVSIDLENAAVGPPRHHGGRRHRHAASQMGRAPAPGGGQGAKTRRVSKDDMIGYLEDKVAKWWLPDDVAFVTNCRTRRPEDRQRILRDQFKDYTLPTVRPLPKRAGKDNMDFDYSDKVKATACQSCRAS